MAFLIGVLMSASTYLLASVVITVMCFIINRNSKQKLFPTFKVLCYSVLGSLVLGFFQPSNTYKYVIERKHHIENMVESKKEIEKIPSILEKDKEERQERFDNLTNWRKEK